MDPRTRYAGCSLTLIALLLLCVCSACSAKTAYCAAQSLLPGGELLAADASLLEESPQQPSKLEAVTQPEGDAPWRAWGLPETARPGAELVALSGDSAPGRSGLKGGGVHSWETGEGKSYLIPAWEVPAFIVLLNSFDRVAFHNKKKDGKYVYRTTPRTTWDHLRKQNWTFDRDRFDVNQFGHPYEGATMYGLARSSGLTFWESALYANVGSFLWEMAGETTRPSINDQITTGNAGSLFGEALFRVAGLVLEDAKNDPDWWDYLLATAVSPPTMFNRWLFGPRFDSVYPSRNPARLWRLSAGGSTNAHLSDREHTTSHHDNDMVAGFGIAYGLPGKPGYSYRRPFDYFDFQVGARFRAKNVLENLTVRGLLLGKEYQAGDDYRGIWGLYGSYDYLGPYIYRASSTALSLGTTGQYWAAPGVAVQGSLLGGFGFGAAGTDTLTSSGRGYHYGGTPQGLAALSVLFGDRTMLDLSQRAYYVTNLGSDHSSGEDLILRSQAGVTVRLVARHAIGLQYTESVRHSYHEGEPHKRFAEGTVSLVYTYLSDRQFGAVEWRQ